MKKIKILIFFVFSLTYCQSEFQILTIPNEVFSFKFKKMKSQMVLKMKLF